MADCHDEQVKQRTMSGPASECAMSASPPSVVDEPSAIVRLRDAALNVAGATGDALFQAVAQAVAELTEVDFAFVGLRDASDDGPYIRTLAFWAQGGCAPNFQYFLRGTPCERVVGREFRHYRTGVAAQFPESSSKAMGVQGYAALPLVGTDGNVAGLIVAMSCRPVEQPVWVEAVLRMFAEKTIAEIERLSTSQALRIAEASYRVVFDASEDPILVHDWDTMQIVAVNQKACDTFGYRQEDFRHLTLADFSVGEASFNTQAIAGWIETARNEGYAEFEWQRKNPDGSLHWDEVRLKAVSIAGERRILTFAREITARKKADAALRASEAKYRAIFESSVDALVLFSRDGTYIDVNPAAVALSGQAKSALLGQRIADAFQPPVHDIDRLRFLADTFEHGFAQAEGTLQFNDRAVRIEARAVAVRDRGEDYALVIVRDVTLARQQQHELARSVSRLRATVDSALDCIITMDEAGRIVDFNPASERCFGIDASAAIGQVFCDWLIAPRFRQVFMAEVPRLSAQSPGIATGTRIEIACIHANGDEIPMELVVGVARAKNTSVVIAYLHDLTSRLAAERAHIELEGQLRQAQKMEALGQLTGGIAHDFNNILTSAIGYVDLVREAGKELRPELKRYLQRSKRAAQRAQDLVQQMLTYSRGSRGEARPTQIETLVGEVVSLLEATLPSSIHIDVDIRSEMPIVALDPVHATQALMNLCINARDAMHGRGSLGIEVERQYASDLLCSSCGQQVRGNHVVIAVTDDGEGMDQATMARIFEPFFSTKPHGKGSGMGLATTHGIVHQFGGHLHVESTPGKGTRFRLLLPTAEDLPGDESEARLDGDFSARSRLAGRILVVDDNKAVGEFMQDLLGSWGLDVSYQSQPAKVLRNFHPDSGEFDLAVIDQTMPDISGLDLAQSILEKRADFPIILYTGFSDSTDEKTVLAAGCRALLRKPLDVAKMRSLVESLLQGAGAAVHR